MDKIYRIQLIVIWYAIVVTVNQAVKLIFHLLFIFFHRLEWPVRTLSFSHDGRMLASASEDLVIDIAEVDSG